MNRRRVMRLVRWIVLLLIGGAIVNVAVAWGLGASMSKGYELGWSGLGADPIAPTLCVHVYSRPGAMSVEAEKSRIAGDCAIPSLPYWSQALRLTTADLRKNMSLLEQARGWPFVTLYWRRIDQNGVMNRIEGGMPLDARSTKALPLFPLWPGFAINTVFYAAVLWLLLIGPGRLRRVLRLRRGLCPACAYDLRGSDSKICPECGKVATP